MNRSPTSSHPTSSDDSALIDRADLFPSEAIPDGDQFAKKDRSRRFARVVACAAIFAQIGVFLVWTNDFVTGIALAVLTWAAALGIRVPGRAWLRASQTYVVLGALIVTKAIVFGYEVDQTRNYINSALAFDVVLFCVMTQLGLLFGHMRRQLPTWYPVLIAVSALFLADVRVTQSERTMLLAVDVLFAATSGLLFRAARRKAPDSDATGWLPHVIATGAVILIGGGTALLLAKYERSIDRLLAKALGVSGPRSAETGFSGEGSLSTTETWKLAGGDEIALRIFSDRRPGYVIGRVMSNYTGRRWNTSAGARPIPPTDEIDIVPAGTLDVTTDQETSLPKIVEPPFGVHLFSFVPTRTIDETIPAHDDRAETASTGDVSADVIYEDVTYEIWPRKNLSEWLLRPTGTTEIALSSTTLPVDSHGNAVCEEDQAGKPYTVYEFRRRLADRPEDATMVEYRTTGSGGGGDDLRLALQRVVGEIFGDQDPRALPVQARCDAVVDYFASNYSYRLGLEKSPRRWDDVVAFFLNELDAAHCEYFASATALLLREVGVPSRYVTGFVADERNEAGGFWIARNRDAHAWCEAWDEQSGRWLVVEATPGGGVPRADPDAPDSWAEALMTRFRRWRAGLQKRDLQAELTDRAADLASPRPLLFVGGCAALAALVLSYLQRRRRGDESLASYHDALEQVTDALRKRHLRRHPAETLRDFAARVADDGDNAWGIDTARWLSDYATARYRRRPESTEPLSEDLSRHAAELAKRIRKPTPRHETATVST